MIRLQFADEPRWWARPIKWFSHGEFCHVDIVADDGALIGARPIRGVARRPPNYLPFTRTLIVDVPVTGQDQATAFLDAQIGKPYDFTAIGGFLRGRDWREDDSWFCSELVAAVLERGGAFPHRLAAPLSKVTPADLLLVLSALLDVRLT